MLFFPIRTVSNLIISDDNMRTSGKIPLLYSAIGEAGIYFFNVELDDKPWWRF